MKINSRGIRIKRDGKENENGNCCDRNLGRHVKNHSLALVIEAIGFPDHSLSFPCGGS